MRANDDLARNGCVLEIPAVKPLTSAIFRVRFVAFVRKSR